MIALLQQYFRIAFLMGRPQDLPAGREQLQSGMVLAFVTHALVVSLDRGLAGALLFAALDLALGALLMWLALSYVKLQSRFAQAYGGLSGAMAFINLSALPLYLGGSATVNGEAGSIEVLAWYVLLVWSLSLVAHVIRHTFEIRLPLSILAALLVFLLMMNAQYALLAWLQLA